MAATKQPIIQNEIHGLYTAGNPTDRPRGSASKCENFRVMPGWWLRLRGGRKGKYKIPGVGIVRQLHSFRAPGQPGSDAQMVQIDYNGSPNWTSFSLLTYVIDPFGIEAITTTNDGAFGATNPAAVVNLYDRPMYYQGLGVRGVSDSKPPFSTYHSGVVRYMGLDAYCPNGQRPTVAFSAGAGHNEVQERVRIYVGLYNSGTDHYSNAVYCGEITGTNNFTGTITVSNLNRLSAVWHNATEQGELKYVFYATLDGAGYSVPYLILNPNYDGPLQVAVSQSSQSLSVVTGFTNGWALDFTKEAPFANHPPRPMRQLAFVNGRIYGVPMQGGAGNAIAMPTVYDPAQIRSDFTYQPTDRDRAGVVWSNSYSDGYSTSHPGDPLQCWPLTNFAATPNGDAPMMVAESQDGRRVVVGTARATYFLTEESDGIHEWFTVSEVHGITNPMTFVTTRYGQAWVDQHNQLVMVPKGTAQVEVLSRNYQTAMVGTVRHCDYLYDPPNEIDRVEMFLSNGTSVCHDFALGGEAYTCTGKDFTASRTVTDSNGHRHHIVAKDALFTQEAQPGTGLIPTTDENWSAGANGFVAAEITGEYHRNWDDFGDCTHRKELDHVAVVADTEVSGTLGTLPVEGELYVDFQEVAAANVKGANVTKALQSATDGLLQFVFSAASARWYKFVYRLRGHSADDAGFANHVNPATQGDLAKNFYGCILKQLFQFKNTVNRP